jgi:hypothetical protein
MKRTSPAFSSLKTALAFLFVATLTWPIAASAAGKRVGIPRFEGQQEALIRKVVMQVVKSKGFELVRSREIESAAKGGLDSNDSYQALAKDMSLSAIVSGEVGKKKAKLTVRNGADGAVIGEGSFAGANPKKLAVEVAKTFWRRLGSAVDRGRVPAGAKKPGKAAVAAAPEDNEDDKEAAAAVADKSDEKDDKAEEKEAKEEKSKAKDSDKASAKSEKEEDKAEEEKPRKKRKKADDEESTAAGGPALRALDLFVGVHLFKRDLTYNQNVGPNKLRPYSLPATTLYAGTVFYPGALGGGTGVAANLGLDVSAELGFKITSKTSTGAQFPTTVHDFAGGLRFRIPLGGGEVALLGTFGEHAFVLKSGPNASRPDLLPDLPDTVYRYARFGAMARAPIGKFSVFGGAAYRLVLSPGQIKDNYFKNLKVAGIDGTAGIGYQVLPAIELRAAFDIRRYGYTFNPKPGDTYIVGGAIDQYIAGSFVVAFTLDGAGGEK